MPEPAGGRLPLRRLIAYGLPGLPLAALTLPVYVYVPTFYATEIGLGLASIGGILLVARLFDVISDPLIGAISDRTRSRFGRRKPWLVVATPLVMLALYQLFVPPGDAGLTHLFLWTMLLYLGWTMVLLPYSAWGAELSPDYHERSRIVGAREICVVLGTVLAASLPTVLTASGAAQGDGTAETLRALAWITLATLPWLIALAVLSIGETPPAAAVAPPFRRGLRTVLRNGPFRRVIGAYLLNGMANGTTATLFFLYVGHVLAAPDAAGPLLLIYFAAGIVSVPLWLAVSRRLGKHRAWALALAVTCAFFAIVPFLGAGDIVAFGFVCVLTGLCLGADLALPASMQADIVDLDSARSGGAQAGLYFALWSMATKLALALAVGIAFPVLQAFGFDAEGTNSGAALGALALLYGLAPIGIKLTAIVFIWGYPIDAARQARLRAAIDRRIARRAAYAPA